jgi:hypothetical protein
MAQTVKGQLNKILVAGTVERIRDALTGLPRQVAAGDDPGCADREALLDVDLLVGGRPVRRVELGGDPLPGSFASDRGAEGRFEDSLETILRIGAVPWLAHTRQDYAQMLVARSGSGDNAGAGVLLARARHTFRAVGICPRPGVGVRHTQGADPPARRGSAPPGRELLTETSLTRLRS